MAVTSGDEMRSYFNTEGDAQALVAPGAKAAERIALFVKGKRVEFGATVVLRLAPFRGNQPLLLQLEQGGVQSP
jgi:hypothetical protein